MFDLMHSEEERDFLMRKKKLEKLKEESALASHKIRQAYKEYGLDFDELIEFSKNEENWSKEDWALLQKERQLMNPLIRSMQE